MKPLRLLLLIVIVIVILACNASLPTEEPPGVGDKAERGYALSEPVIAALEEYKEDNGVYPEALAELAPNYLPAVPKKNDELDFSYSSTGDSFTFSFHYVGPGMNTCAYTPEKQWQCSGAY